MRALILGLCAILLSAAPAFAQLYDGGDGASITVKENDNTPTVSGVNSISFTNGTVTDDGGGALGHGLGHADPNALSHPNRTGRCVARELLDLRSQRWEPRKSTPAGRQLRCTSGANSGRLRLQGRH